MSTEPGAIHLQHSSEAKLLSNTEQGPLMRAFVLPGVFIECGRELSERKANVSGLNLLSSGFGHLADSQPERTSA